MDTKTRCQSCGMPLGEGMYGTYVDGSETTRYCRFCFQNGAFTEPGITLEQMVEKSIKHMTAELKMPLPEATDLANAVIPKLARWQH